MRVCVHHIVRPSTVHLAPGCEDCTVCTPDEANRNCRRYVPVTLGTFEVFPGDQPPSSRLATSSDETDSTKLNR